jgi:hypothetical protein
MQSLTQSQLRKLKLWQKKMLYTFVPAILVIVIGVPIKLVFGLAPEIEFLLGGAFIVLSAAGAVIQFSEKCPNCGARIGFQSRLLLPKKCSKCKISFRGGSV